MNDQLDFQYLLHLKMGLIIMREAIGLENQEWQTAEIELLHNIPSLVGEANKSRHLYFWHEERGLYLDRISALSNLEPKTRMRTYYEPIWKDMEPLIEKL